MNAGLKIKELSKKLVNMDLSEAQRKALLALLDADDAQAGQTPSKPAQIANSAHTASQGKLSKKGYGQAVTPEKKLSNGDRDLKAIHLARVHQLENAIPGISKFADIFSLGKTGTTKNAPLTRRARAKGKYQTGIGESEFGKMVNGGIFTWIELSGGKDTKIGKLDPNQVRAGLKACGYSWSQGNLQWVTKTNGRPAFFGRCYKAGRKSADTDDE